MGSWLGLQVCPVAKTGTAGASTPSVAPLTYATDTPPSGLPAEPGLAPEPTPDLAVMFPARSAVPGRATGLPGGRVAAVDGLFAASAVEGLCTN